MLIFESHYDVEYEYKKAFFGDRGVGVVSESIIRKIPPKGLGLELGPPQTFFLSTPLGEAMPCSRIEPPNKLQK